MPETLGQALDQWKGQTNLKAVVARLSSSAVSPIWLVYLPVATLDAPGSSVTAWLMAATAVPMIDSVSSPMTKIAASFGLIAVTPWTATGIELFYTSDSGYARFESGFLVAHARINPGYAPIRSLLIIGFPDAIS